MAAMITTTPVTTATEGQLYVYDVDATDPNPSDVLRYLLVSGPAAMDIDMDTGVITWTPPNDDDAMVTVRVEDGNGGFAIQSYTITVQPSAGPTLDRIIVSLDADVANAGQTFGFSLTFIDNNGDPFSPEPAVDCAVTGDGATAEGTLPVIAGGTEIQTAADTRGIHEVTCVDPTSNVSDSAEFISLTPAADGQGEGTQSALYGDLGEGLGMAATLTSKLDQAIFDNDVAAIPDLLNALTAERDNVDLVQTQRSTAFAPEVGFLPTPAELEAAGFGPGADDGTYADKLEAIRQNMEETSALLATIADFTNISDADGEEFERLNTELLVLLAELDALSPSLHGLVSNSGMINLFLATTLPEHFHDLVNEYEEALQDNGLAFNGFPTPMHRYAELLRPVGETGPARLMPAAFARGPSHYGMMEFQRPELRKAFTLIGLSSAMNIRMTIVRKVYFPILKDIARAVALLAANDLLNQFVNNVQLFGIQTGASLSIHDFTQPGSAIEGSPINPIPGRNDVFLVGPNQVSAVEGLLNVFNPSGVESLEDIYNFFEGIVDAIEGAGESYDEVHQLPSDTGQCFLFGTTPPCQRTEYQGGFDSVASCGFICLPTVVLVISHNLDSGEWAFNVFNFLSTR